MAFSEAVKKAVRIKSHHCCCICKSVGVEVHHVVPQEHGGPDTEDNAAPLCPSCHEIYGANKSKRKFVQEIRDTWYEICAKRYAQGPELEEIKRSIEELKEDVREHLLSKFSRSSDEVLENIDELVTMVWYNRHQVRKEMIESGDIKLVKKETFPPKKGERRPIQRDIWEGALKAAKGVEKQYGIENLGPWDDFEWGMINGKLSALRWVMGDEWDMLDT
jgi:hypothetical protein